MKKSLIALAVLATAGVASAQSSVTLFGIVDATLAFGKGSGVGSSNKTALTNSGYNSSRLGFRGTEDLGGGMSASFWLEAGLANDDGQGAGTSANNQTAAALPFNPVTGANATARAGQQGLTFNRRSTVSLAGNFGEVRLGRDYTPQFWNLTVFDPFGTNGVGTTQTLSGINGANLGGPTTVRASNSMGYFLPKNLGGFYGQVQYYLGENIKNGAATEKDGTGAGVRVGYAAGPINAALAFSSTKYAAGNIKTTNLGGQYDLGVAKLMAHYNRDRVSGGATGKGYLLGGLIPMGAGEIRVAYSTYKVDVAGTPKSSKFALGYVHNLSKRTALYTTFARVGNKGGAFSPLNGAATAPNNSSTGYDFGIRHSF
ncbi:MAG: porin [Ramlibacter sp.]|nr:porin [Ramlibacter sp.]